MNVTTIKDVYIKTINWGKTFLAKHEYLRVFLTFFGIGMLFYASKSLPNYLTLPMNGDYVLQQLPFYVEGYDKLWKFILTGEFPMWSFENFLGVNYYGANTFYYLTSPFMILMLLVPRIFISQMIFIMMIVKFAVGGTLFYFLLRKYFKVSENASFIGGLIYGFGGWAIFYLWFNHFSDVLALFPLTLIGVEHLIQYKKGWLLTFGLVLLGMANYFFLFAFTFTTTLYAIFRYFQHYRLISWKIVLVLLIGLANIGWDGYLFFKDLTGLLVISGLVQVIALVVLYGFKSPLSKLQSAINQWLNSFKIPYLYWILIGVGVLFLIGVPLSLFTGGQTNGFLLVTLLELSILGLLLLKKNPAKKELTESFSVLGIGIVSFFSGLLIVSFVLYPSFLVVIDTPRVSGATLLIDFFRFFFVDPQKNGGGYVLGELKTWAQFSLKDNLDSLFDFIFQWDDKGNVPAMQSFLYPLAQFLYPTSANWDTLVFRNTSFDNTISSMYITIPIALLLWSSIIDTFKRHRIWEIVGLIIAFILPFIPFTYYLLHAFTVDYGRWQLFMIAIMLVYIIPKLDHLETLPRWHLDVGMILHVGLAIAVAYYSYTIDKLDMTARVYIVGASILYTIGAYIYLRFKAKGPSILENLTLLVVIELFVATTITLNLHGVANYSELYGGQGRLAEQQQLINEIKKEDPGFYRIYNQAADRSYPNLPMTLGYNGLSTFHSVYDYALYDFVNDWSRISYSGGNWAMGIHEKRYNLDTFLNVKYYLLPDYDTNIPLGFEKIKESDHYVLYRNNNFIELGYAFDQIISYNNFDTYKSAFNYEAGYLQAAVIENDDFLEVSDLLKNEVTVLSYTQSTFREASSPTMYYIARGAEPLVQPIANLSAIKNLMPEERHPGGSNVYNFYGRWIERGWDGDKIVLYYNQPVCANIAEGCHIIVNFSFGPNAEISLYNDDNVLDTIPGTLVTRDSHMIHNYDKTWDHKSARGFYVDQPFNKVVIEFVNDATYELASKFPVSTFYEPYTTYRSRLETLKANAFENVTVTTNTFAFESNYSDAKMAVLSVPYDVGWALHINGEAQKIYEVTGGFIGFIAPAGNATYALNYETPGLKRGIQLSVIGFIIFGLLTLWIERRKIFKKWLAKA